MIRFKQITSILVLLMSLSCTVPAMAAPSDGTGNTEYTGISEKPEGSASDEASAAESSAYEAKAVRVINTVAETDTATEAAEEEEAAEEAKDASVAEEQNSVLSGSKVVEFARQFLGRKYRYGGTNLASGTDCSGFTMAVYRNFGITLPHSSRSQRSIGTAVGSLEEAKAGDLICYSGHVALYMGNGQIIHSMNSKKGVVISNARYKSILAIRRVL